MKASKITIGRLFNLGNYEHIRYEIAEDLQPGESAETALRGIEQILDALNPKRPDGAKSTSELLGMRRHIVSVQEMSDDDVANRYGKSKAIVVAGLEREFAKVNARSLAWGNHQAAARAALDDLGGSFTQTDHKAFWEDSVWDDEF